MSITIPLRAGFSALAFVAIGAVVVSTLTLADGRLDETEAASAAAERLRHSLLLDDIVEAAVAESGSQRAVAVLALGLDLGSIEPLIEGDLRSSQQRLDERLLLLADREPAAAALISGDLAELRAQIDAGELSYVEVSGRYQQVIDDVIAVARAERLRTRIDVASLGDRELIVNVSNLERLGDLTVSLATWLVDALEVGFTGSESSATGIVARAVEIDDIVRADDLDLRTPDAERFLARVEAGSADRIRISTMAVGGTTLAPTDLIAVGASERTALVSMAQLRDLETAIVQDELQDLGREAARTAQLLIVFALVVAFGGAGVVILVARFSTRRMQSLIDLAEDIRIGAPIEPDGRSRVGVTELDDLAARLRTMAEDLRSDELTGLSNRTGLSSVFERAGSGAVIAVDLDGFKPVNDEHGHLVGDKVLRELARRMRAELRDTDVVARTGGDEFVVLVPDAAVADAVADRIRDLSARPFEVVEGVSIRISASVGVAEIIDGGLNAAVAKADDALYEEKRRRPGRAAPV